MRIPLFSAALLAAAGATAAAQPAPCQVEILRAPPDVQPVIEDWVKAERACGPALKVRVVPTTGGLYVFAEDATGRVRERVVPDATTAAVLIASWAADDGAPAATPPAPPAPPPGPAIATQPEPPAAPPAPPTAPAIAMEPPVPPAPPPAPTAPPPSPPSMVHPSVVLVDGGSGGRRGSRSLDIGAITTFSTGGQVSSASFGAKLGVDLRRRHGIDLGLAVGLARSEFDYYDYGAGYMNSMVVDDLRVMARAALDRGAGRWSGRLELGAGVALTHAMSPDGLTGDGYGAAPYVELGATLGYSVTDRWRLRAGPVATYTDQDLRGDTFELLRGMAIEGWAGVDRRF